MSQSGDVGERLIRLEEQAYFQEEELAEIRRTLLDQDARLERLERAVQRLELLVRGVAEMMGEAPEAGLPPHSMPERY